MLHRRIINSLKLLGCATKITFAQGHGYSLEEVKLMEKERKGHVQGLRSQMKEEWHIPKHVPVGQAFSYETEVFSFVRRIRCNSLYVTEHCRAAGEHSLLSSALMVVLSHHSSCSNEKLIKLKNDICDVGKMHLTSYIMKYFKLMFPNITSEILYKLSVPETCLSSAKCFSLYKHLCLHELIRTNSSKSLALEDYSDAVGGIFLSILLFDKHSFISAPLFLQSCVLNYYSQLDFRNIVDYDNIDMSEKKLHEFLISKNKTCSPEIRIISIDGEDSPVPTFNVGIFVGDECIASTADVSVKNASLHACNAAISNLLLSECNPDVNMNFIDFENLPEELNSKKIEFEEEIKELLEGVDLSKMEMGNKAKGRTVIPHHKNFENIQNLRQMRYK